MATNGQQYMPNASRPIAHAMTPTRRQVPGGSLTGLWQTPRHIVGMLSGYISLAWLLLR